MILLFNVTVPKFGQGNAFAFSLLFSFPLMKLDKELLCILFPSSVGKMLFTTSAE